MFQPRVLSVLIVAAAAASLLTNPSFARAEKPAEEGFTALFDGKTLNGWEGDARFWSVQDGVIVGSTDQVKAEHNTFLCTTKKYADFVLKLEFKLRNHNSGVQIRSERLDDFIVKGYQADMAEQRYMGILYEERGRGILADVKPDEVAKHVKAGDWNEYVITCKGPRIRLEINGFTTVDYEEKDPVGAKEGIIALQLHQGPAMRVEFRNIRIRELR
ncbi:MAG: 3-keto-disaccharide hydrolase [Thermogutta sp.]